MPTLQDVFESPDRFFGGEPAPDGIGRGLYQSLRQSAGFLPERVDTLAEQNQEEETRRRREVDSNYAMSFIRQYERDTYQEPLQGPQNRPDRTANFLETFRERFPDLDPAEAQRAFSRLATEHDNETRIARIRNQARERAENESGGEWFSRHGIPIVSTVRNLVSGVEYGRARRRIHEGKEQPNDERIVADYEARQAEDLKSPIQTASAGIPAAIGEMIVGGAAVRTIGQAAAPLAASGPRMVAAPLRYLGAGAAESAPLASVQGLAQRGVSNIGQTATMPSMWAPGWVDNNLQANRDPLDPRGLPSAFAMGYLNVAVLGSFGRAGNAITANGVKGQAARLLTRTAVGMLEQDGINTMAEAVSEVLPVGYKLKTGYGFGGHILHGIHTGDFDPLLSHAFGQALTFAAFSVLHEVQTPKQAVKRIEDSLNESHRMGLPQAEAAKRLLEQIPSPGPFEQRGREVRPEAVERAPVQPAQEAMPEGMPRGPAFGQGVETRIPEPAARPQVRPEPPPAPEPAPQARPAAPESRSPMDVLSERFRAIQEARARGEVPMDMIGPEDVGMALQSVGVSPKQISRVKKYLGGESLEKIGQSEGVSKQAVHKSLQALAEKIGLKESIFDAVHKDNRADRTAMMIELGRTQEGVQLVELKNDPLIVEAASRREVQAQQMLDAYDALTNKLMESGRLPVNADKIFNSILKEAESGKLTRARIAFWEKEIAQADGGTAPRVGVAPEAPPQVPGARAETAPRVSEPAVGSRVTVARVPRVHEEFSGTVTKLHPDGTMSVLPDGETGTARISPAKLKDSAKPLGERLADIIASAPEPVPEPMPSAAQTTYGQAPTPEQRLAGSLSGGQENATDAPRAMRKTALANAQMDAERQARGAPEILGPARQANQAVWDRAMERFERDPLAGEGLVEQLTKSPRATTVEENAVLLRHKVALQNEHEKSMLDYVRMFREKAPPEKLIEAETRESLLMGQLDQLDRVTKSTGTEWGRAGQFRRQLAAEDFSLSGMMFRARKAKGAELTGEESAKVADLNKKISELNQRIGQLEADIFNNKAMNERNRTMLGENPNKELTKAKFEYSDHVKLYQEFVKSKEFQKKTVAEKTWSWISEIYNLQRSIFLGADLPPIFRQGMLFTLGNPAESVKAFGKTAKSFLSRERAFEIESSLMESPSMKDGSAQRAGLEFSSTEGALGQHEEAFRSSLVKHIPVLAGLERWHSAFMNQVRVKYFETMRQSLAGGGTEAELKVIANAANVLTGRGSMGHFEPAVGALSAVFTSPRYVVSRFQTLLGQPLWHGNMQTRRAVAKEYAKSALGLSALLGAAYFAKLGGLPIDTELDMRSSDFGKIRIGETRLDPYGGVQQGLVFLSRLLTGKTKTLSGNVVDIRGADLPFGRDDAADVAFRFVRGKMAPIPGTALDVTAGRNMVGQPVSPQRGAVRLVTPLTMSDIWEAFADLGFPKGLAVSIWAILGGGTQSHSRASRR